MIHRILENWSQWRTHLRDGQTEAQKHFVLDTHKALQRSPEAQGKKGWAKRLITLGSGPAPSRLVAPPRPGQVSGEGGSAARASGRRGSSVTFLGLAAE